jgi:hypothetical protein
MMINFLVSSHISSHKKHAEKLIKSLLKCGVKNDQILVVVGGAEFEQTIRKNNITYAYVNHNSYDHTGLIYLLESNNTNPWWWVLHDTTEVGSNFLNLIAKRGCTHDHIAIGDEGWLNMGLFSLKFITECKNYILSLKNCSKLRAILSERVYPKLTESSSYCGRHGFSFLAHRDVYGDGVIRRVIYYPEIDLYKYQSFYIEKKETLEYLRSQELGPKNYLSTSM